MTMGAVPSPVIPMDLDPETAEAASQSLTRLEELMARSLGEGESCADVMDVVDEDVEMGGPLGVTDDVEMMLGDVFKEGDDLVLKDWDVGELEDTAMSAGLE